MRSAPLARPRWAARLAVVAALLLLLAALVAWLNVAAEEPLEPASAPVPATAALIERGAYLAKAGNCMGCHTTAGGAEFAGGKGIETPFGRVFASNITPDATTGIGSWSPAEFWRAMHHGRSRDGRLLYPAFPYPSFTSVTREDSDALHAYLRSVEPVHQENKPHALAFPFSTQAALAVWRALYFRPGEFVAEQSQTAEWNRGRYLVQGLGHCAACHSTRNVMGGTGLSAEFAGGLMPDGAWYAPSLASPGEAGVQGWSREQVVKLLKDGASAHATVSGPMAEVVYSSTQHLAGEDLDAMAEYLGSLAVREDGPKAGARASAEALARGAKLYGQHCASCHGVNGEGAPSIYPALAGNRAVVLEPHHNLVQVIRHGGFSPSTAGNPQPFGMPPFAQVLGDDDIAAVTTFVRQSWGNSAAAVSEFDVYRVK